MPNCVHNDVNLKKPPRYNDHVSYEVIVRRWAFFQKRKCISGMITAVAVLLSFSYNLAKNKITPISLKTVDRGGLLAHW